jgi:glycosyltransferase involved in cell wall biosynthesis
MKLSVCIPAFNRPDQLTELLASISHQDLGEVEIVISDDHSPKADDLAAVVERFRQAHPLVEVQFWRNDETLGYDGNLRRLLERARGDHCMFMGDDDLVLPGALQRILTVLTEHPEIGVLLRSYSTFQGSPRNIVQEYRYFPSDRYFPPGPDTVTTFFRRSVVISGMIVHRASAVAYSTDRFDGTLLYQLHLVGNVLLDRAGYYLKDLIVSYRLGGIHSFGVSAKEKGRYVPHIIPPSHSLAFMEGMFAIARSIEDTRHVSVYRPIMTDIGNYSYPILTIQADHPAGYVWYAAALARRGLWRNRFFVGYFFLILLLRPRRIDRLIGWTKRRLGYTPLFGRIYAGELPAASSANPEALKS